MSIDGHTLNIPDAALAAIPRPVVAHAADFAAGYHITPHDHIHAQLIHGSQGVMQVRAGEGSWVVPPERGLWVPAGIEHEIVMRGRVAMRTLYIQADALPAMPAHCAVVAVGPLLQALIERAVAAPPVYDEQGPDGRIFAVILDELKLLPTIPLHLPTGRDRRLRRVTAALEAAPGDGRPLEAWAREAGASPRTLARLFLRETGMTFGAWRQQARLLHALIGLAEGQAVTALALDLGYASPSAFIQAFKRAFGTTPSRYFRAG